MALQPPDPLDYLAKRLLWHFGETVEPETVAKLREYIEPTVKRLVASKLPAKPKQVRTKIKGWDMSQRLDRNRAKYTLIRTSIRGGYRKPSKSLDKLAIKPIF